MEEKHFPSRVAKPSSKILFSESKMEASLSDNFRFPTVENKKN
jgi:hypothetical protein